MPGMGETTPRAWFPTKIIKYIISERDSIGFRVPTVFKQLERGSHSGYTAIVYHSLGDYHHIRSLGGNNRKPDYFSYRKIKWSGGVLENRH